MSPEEITSIRGWFLRSMAKRHMDFSQLPASLTMITSRTGSDNILPGVFTTKVFWPNMIYCQLARMTSAILADVLVTTKDFTARQFYL
jgi:hypothetical protein